MNYSIFYRECINSLLKCWINWKQKRDYLEMYVLLYPSPLTDVILSQVLMNMRVDTLLAAGDLAGVLTVLQKMQGRNDQLPKRRLPRLLETFSSCEDKNLQQSFQELKLLS